MVISELQEMGSRKMNPTGYGVWAMKQPPGRSLAETHGVK